jgi:hypothetical protein
LILIRFFPWPSASSAVDALYGDWPTASRSVVGCNERSELHRPHARLSQRKINSNPQITQENADESEFVLIRFFCGHPRHLR